MTELKICWLFLSLFLHQQCSVLTVETSTLVALSTYNNDSEALVNTTLGENVKIKNEGNERKEKNNEAKVSVSLETDNSTHEPLEDFYNATTNKQNTALVFNTEETTATNKENTSDIATVREKSSSNKNDDNLSFTPILPEEEISDYLEHYKEYGQYTTTPFIQDISLILGTDISQEIQNFDTLPDLGSDEDVDAILGASTFYDDDSSNNFDLTTEKMKIKNEVSEFSKIDELLKIKDVLEEETKSKEFTSKIATNVNKLGNMENNPEIFTLDLPPSTSEKNLVNTSEENSKENVDILEGSGTIITDIIASFEGEDEESADNVNFEFITTVTENPITDESETTPAVTEVLYTSSNEKINVTSEKVKDSTTETEHVSTDSSLDVTNDPLEKDLSTSNAVKQDELSIFTEKFENSNIKKILKKNLLPNRKSLKIEMENNAKIIPLTNTLKANGKIEQVKISSSSGSESVIVTQNQKEHVLNSGESTEKIEAATEKLNSNNFLSEIENAIENENEDVLEVIDEPKSEEEDSTEFEFITIGLLTTIKSFEIPLTENTINDDDSKNIFVSLKSENVSGVEDKKNTSSNEEENDFVDLESIKLEEKLNGWLNDVDEYGKEVIEDVISGNDFSHGNNSTNDPKKVLNETLSEGYGKNKYVYGKVLNEKGKMCFSTNMTLKILINDTVMDIPSDSLLKGICNGNEKYIMVTWRSKSDHLINNSVSLNLTVNNGVHYINAAQINISDVNPLNNIRILLSMEKKVVSILKRKTRNELVVDQDEMISFDNGVALKISNMFLFVEDNPSVIKGSTARNANDNNFTLIAIGVSSLIIVTITIGAVFLYVHLKKHVFKLSLE